MCVINSETEYRLFCPDVTLSRLTGRNTPSLLSVDRLLRSAVGSAGLSLSHPQAAVSVHAGRPQTVAGHGPEQQRLDACAVAGTLL